MRGFMMELQFRKGTREDLEEIMHIQEEVFTNEQEIPIEMLGIEEEQNPRWYLALDGKQIIGTCCAWVEEGKTHFGRFAIRNSYRGKHIGKQLLQYAYDDLFANGEEILWMEARDTSVHLIVQMGGEVIGEPVQFTNDRITPIILEKNKYHK